MREPALALESLHILYTLCSPPTPHLCLQANMGDDDEHDETFESQDSGAAESYPIEAGQIRKGGLIMIKGRPCKVSPYFLKQTLAHHPSHTAPRAPLLPPPPSTTTPRTTPL